MIKAREDVSKLTIARMAVYYSTLKKMKEDGELICASTQLGQRTGVASSVVRRDLAYFGGFGTKGVGYEVDFLLSWIGEILGYNTVWHAVFVGVDIPLTGISSYSALLPPGFRITAAVDLDKKNHGYKVPGLGLAINPIEILPRLIAEHKISIGLMVVPPKQAQKVANLMVKAGIKGIANFSPVSVCVPENISLSQINLAACLSQLSYNLSTELSETNTCPAKRII